MEAWQCRKQHLINIIEDTGSIKELSSIIDTDPNYISQIKNSIRGKKMGSRLARKIELKLSLPCGFLDAAPSNLSKINTPELENSIKYVIEKMTIEGCLQIKEPFNVESITKLIKIKYIELIN